MSKKLDKEIVFYSKKTGINQLLFVSNSLSGSNEIFDSNENIKKHKPYAYALIDGVEIKLFKVLEDD